MLRSQLLVVLALLVSNAARGLASRLTRGLAFAATAVLNGVLDFFGFDRFNSFHGSFLQVKL